MDYYPMDYYDTIIAQREALQAAQILADECRKKDAALKGMIARFYRDGGSLRMVAEVVTAKNALPAAPGSEE
jgi:hypothetical protein